MPKNKSVVSVPGLLIDYLKKEREDFRNPNLKASKAENNKFAKNKYLKLEPQKQAEIFEEFYYSLDDNKKNQLLEQAVQLTIEDPQLVENKKFEPEKRTELLEQFFSTLGYKNESVNHDSIELTIDDESASAPSSWYDSISSAASSAAKSASSLIHSLAESTNNLISSSPAARFAYDTVSNPDVKTAICQLAESRGVPLGVFLYLLETASAQVEVLDDTRGSGKPTSTPTSTPIVLPTSQPTLKPNSLPSSKPTLLPTAIPTRKPNTAHPTKTPLSPSSSPSLVPTANQTDFGARSAGGDNVDWINRGDNKYYVIGAVLVAVVAGCCICYCNSSTTQEESREETIDDRFSKNAASSRRLADENRNNYL